MRDQRLSRDATKTLHYYSGVALNDKEYIPNILLSDILVGRFFCTSGVGATVLVYAAVSTPSLLAPSPMIVVRQLSSALVLFNVSNITS